MEQGVRFKEKLHDPRTASREQLASQVRNITDFLILVAADFEKRIGTIHDHFELLKELVETSKEQRKAWHEDNLQEFFKKGKKTTELQKQMDSQVLSIFNSVQVMLKEEQVSVSLLQLDEKDLERLKEFTLEDYDVERREYSVFFAVAKEKLGEADKEIKAELEYVAKLIAVHEKLIEILSRLPQILQQLAYFVQQEQRVLKYFIYEDGIKFEPVVREQQEKYLEKMILQIEAKLIQEKKSFYDPFNELARSEVTPVDNFAEMIVQTREKTLRITKKDIQRIERTLTEPDEFLMIASVLKGHEDIVDEDAKDYAFDLMKRSRKGIKEVKLKATHDLLTRIKNRHSFEEDIKETVKDKKTFSIMMIDIDHFKQFNDTYGHDIGDKVLVEVADMIKKGIRQEKDECYRIGGEELVVILSQTTMGEAHKIGENIRQAIANHKMTDYEGKTITGVTISAGIITIEEYSFMDALKLQTGDVVKKAMKQADDLLYAAKSGGRNNIKKDFFDPLYQPKAKKQT